MRALRVVLALLLAAGSVQAQPVVDLLTRYAVPTDQTASSAPEGDAPPGSGKKLAELEAYLALVSEGLEAFAHPQDAEKALRAAKPRLPDGTSPFFRDRATALDTLYRTLAVVDYSWALRFPDPPCSPAAKRARLLRSDDGLFLDPISGKTSSWMAALLGPTAKDKSLEASLDQASISAAPSQAEYARLRARQNLITKALDSEDAVGEARAKLYCKRAEVREKLASSNRASGPVLAPRSSGEGNSRRGVVIMAGRTADDLEIRGAGVVVETKSGIRVLTDRRLGAGTVVALVDGNHQPVPLSIERDDEKSGLMLLRPDGDVGEAMAIGEAAPKKDDLVFAFAHSDRLGAWTRTQGLVTSADVGQFQTDAVADASMTGGAILDEAGVLAGVLVLRRAGDGGGEWPAAVPAPALRAWIDGGDAPEASPAPISDAGTTKILTASRPLLESVAVGQGAISASADSFTQRTPWGSTTRAVCVANCGDSSPGASYSGGGNGNAELGQALGKLAAIGVQALIFKGIPALFRGIGSLFKSNPSKGETRKESANSNHETKRKEPEKLPDPILKFDLTTKRLDDSIIFSARVTANRKDVRLNNIAVGFTVNGSTQPLVRTDDDGLAVLKVYTPRSIAAHESLDEESAKHPWLTNASRIVTKQNLCIVTLFGATAAVGVVLVAPAPIALVTTTGVALAANPPATVSSCVIIAKVTS
ncbi:MAG: trypsin-like peptidase domain-containing protein, partial [Elusimicrobia bacterium]|nr:trypsin-like peptidase domain-containing protein [Elusimicrobiota bacterium]